MGSERTSSAVVPPNKADAVDDCASDQVQEQTIQPANAVISGNGEACGSIAPPAPAESQAGMSNDDGTG